MAGDKQTRHTRAEGGRGTGDEIALARKPKDADPFRVSAKHDGSRASTASGVVVEASVVSLSEPDPPHMNHSLEQKLRKLAPQASDGRAFLLVVEGPRAGRLHLLTQGESLIGRDESAEIALLDPLVSQRHARIVCRSDGYYLLDLGSRNGTLVNGAPVQEVRLRRRDVVQIGETSMVFFEDSGQEAALTVAAPVDRFSGAPAPLARPVALTTTGEAVTALQPALPPPKDDPVADVMRMVVMVWRFLKRNVWVLVPLPVLGLALGVLSLRLFPGPQTVRAVVKLTHEGRQNPVSDRYTRSNDTVFFENPPQNFANGELVRATLEQLEVPVTDARVSSIRQGLEVEGERTRATTRRYTVHFSQPSSPPPPFELAPFLEVYLENYLSQEIDKAIRVLKSEAGFLEQELAKVDSELEQVESELVDYRRKHLGSLPEQATAALSGTQQINMRRSDLELEVNRLRMQVANTRAQLEDDTALISDRAAAVRQMQQTLQAKQLERQTLLQQGLKPDHPKVRAVDAEITSLQAQISNQATSQVASLERRVDPHRVELERQLRQQEGELRVAETALHKVTQQLAGVTGKAAKVPEVSIQVGRLERRQQALQEMRSRLFEQQRTSQLQIDLETANVQARYEVISPPRIDDRLDVKFLALRVGLGLACGVFLALVLTALLEGRRFFKQRPELLKA